MLHLAVWSATAVAAWRCYRRTRKAGFLWLGAVLTLWPIVSIPADAAIHHVIQHAIEQQERPWGMTPGTLAMRFSYLKQLVGFVLVAVSLSVLARSFKTPGPSGVQLSEQARPKEGNIT